MSTDTYNPFPMSDRQAETIWRYMTVTNEVRALLETVGVYKDTLNPDDSWDYAHAAQFMRALAAKFDEAEAAQLEIEREADA